MFLNSWLRNFQTISSTRTIRPGRSRRPGPMQPERLETRCLLSAGQLDPTFGVGGMVSSDFLGSAQDSAGAVTVQDDGKIVIVGNSSDGGGNTRLALARYNPDGSLDGTFGSGGLVATSLSVSFSPSSAVVQSNGQVVVAGSGGNYGSSFVLVRYNTDGIQDTNFGAGGTVVTNVNSNFSYDKAVTLDGDGKIIMVGHAQVQGTSGSYSYDFAMARYNTDGSLDTTFGGGDGIVTTNFGSDDVARSVAVQSDGKIVVVGGAYYAGMQIARYNSDGSLDTSFDGDGKMVVSGTGNGTSANSVAIQADGKLVIAGSFYNTYLSTTNFLLVRCNINGGLDTDFDVDGKVTTDFGYGHAVARSVAITDDHRIVAIGFRANSGYFGTAVVFAVARYNSNGTPDASFDDDGKAVADFDLRGYGSPDYNSRSMGSLQSDGKIVVVDTRYGTNPTQDFAMVRFDISGSLDAGFGNGGKVSTDFLGHGSDAASRVAIQPDGKIVVAGTPGGSAGLARYNSDGSLDTSFGIGGWIRTTAFDAVTDLAVQSDGKIVATGYTIFTNYSSSVVRYLADGTPDPSFDDDGKVALAYDQARAVALQADGKIVIVGGAGSYGGSVVLTRLNNDGLLDASFDGDGIVTIDQANYDGLGGGRDVAIRPDGKIDVVSDYYDATNQFDIIVFQYNPNGSPDQTFGQNGVATADFGGSSDYFGHLAVGLDNKILVAATASGASQALALARFNSDGSLDPGFGRGDGKVLTDGFSAANVALTPDGKIVLGGTSYALTYTGEFAVARYLRNGTLDPTFGQRGIVTTDFGSVGYPARCADLAVQSDRNIVAVGWTNGTTTGADFALARYEGGPKKSPQTPGGAITLQPAMGTLSQIVIQPLVGETLRSWANSGVDAAPLDDVDVRRSDRSIADRRKGLNGDYKPSLNRSVYDDGVMNVLKGGAGQNSLLASMIDQVFDQDDDTLLLLLN